MSSFKPLPLTKILLNFLTEAKGSVVELGTLWSALTTRYGSAYFKGGDSYVTELKQIKQHSDLKRKIYELARRRYIRIQRVGRRFIISLTDKGYTSTILQRLKQTKPHHKGWYTIVIFDIPEQMSSGRKQLRLLLKQGGFRRLQQSVWVSSDDAYAIITEFVKSAKVGKWINVYYATNFLIPPL